MTQPVIYYQTDPRWKNVSYSAKGESTTIGASGCGPSAMSMVLATWADKSVTPKTECAWALKNGWKCPHSGTYYGYFVPAAKRYGLTCKQLNGASIYGNSSSPYHAQAKAAIDNNDLVIACMGKGLWTRSGHYVTVWNIKGNTIYINDPASSRLARTQGDYSLFKKQVKYYWVIKNPNPGAKTVTTKDTYFIVKVTDKTGLNCRTGAGIANGVVKTYPYGTGLTITKITSDNTWGFTGEGWINLTNTEKVSTTTKKEDELDMTIDQMIANMSNKQAYELMAKAMLYMGELDEPGWSKTEGHWAKATADGTINGGAPQRPVLRDEMVAILGRKGLL